MSACRIINHVVRDRLGKDSKGNLYVLVIRVSDGMAIGRRDATLLDIRRLSPSPPPKVGAIRRRKSA